MATTVSLNGTNYTIGQLGDDGSVWAGSGAVDGYLIALATNVLTKGGGAFTLTSDVNFGATFGIVSAYVKSTSASIAAAGTIRLANADSVSFRNAGNTADLTLKPSATGDGILAYGAVDLVNLSAAQTLTNKALSGAANTFTNIPYAALSLSAGIVNADISSSAAIARSKVASGTANAVLINDGSGNLSSETTLAKSRGGTAQDNSSVTFPASGTIDARVTTTSGDIQYGGASGVPTRLPKGADGTFLSLVSGLPAWANSTGLVDPMTTRGDTIIRNTSNVTARLGVGSANQVVGTDGTDITYRNLLALSYPTTTSASATVSATRNGTNTYFVTPVSNSVVTADNTFKKGDVITVYNGATRASGFAVSVSANDATSLVGSTTGGGNSVSYMARIDSPATNTDWIPRFTNGTTLVCGLVRDWRTYIGGTTYNSVALNVTSAKTGWALARGTFMPYQTNDGMWHLRFNLRGTFTLDSTVTSVQATIAGVTFKNVASYFQACSAMTSSVIQVKACYAIANTGVVEMDSVSGSASDVSMSGDVELDSKPTWAD